MNIGIIWYEIANSKYSTHSSLFLFSFQLQLTSIILEFGGDLLYLKILNQFENNISQNEEILPEAKEKLLKFISFMRAAAPYIKGLHKSLFYLGSTKYQLSKRLTGINYVLIRHWIQPGYSLYGYKVLGIVTILQLFVSSTFNIYEAVTKAKAKQEMIQKKTFSRDRDTTSESSNASPCSLCLEPRQDTSLTTCGHLFCWDCIIDWLDEREECPICREKLKKSNVVQLQNYIWCNVKLKKSVLWWIWINLLLLLYYLKSFH